MQRLFDSVKEKLADPTTFAVLMIDGVESLTSARKNASCDRECSDSLRMVNSLLTHLNQLDQLDLEVARFYNQHSFSGKNLNLRLPVNIS